MACCASNRAPRPAQAPAFDKGEAPCKPVVDRPVLLTGVKAVLDLDQVDHTPLFVAVEFLPATDPSITTDFKRGELLPSLDLITTLGVLLI